MFKALRIFILLLVLAGVALSTWRTRTQSVEWKYSLPINIYLINGDHSPVTAEYLLHLTTEDFKPVEKFIRDEALRYGRTSQETVDIRLQGKIDSIPPDPPLHSSYLEAISWSLQMRWWAYRNTETIGPGPQVKMFLLYFDPDKNKRLDHSTGLQKGLLGKVNVFAASDMARQNYVIITHEFLHTLGATDKYDPITNLPLFPQGYANPELKPLLPQRYAEIMAGRTPLSTTKAEIPTSLDDTLIGEQTAREINWM